MGYHSEFLDVRQHGFARVAVCVPEVRVADPAFNASAHLKVLESVHKAGAHYALCPELGLSAYSCGDLFFQDALLRAANEALQIVASASAAWNMIISVGLPLVVDGLLFNCAVTLYRGRPLAVTPKAYPPNYREFYELRWFQPADAARATTIRVLGQDVPFGTDVLLRAQHLPGFVLHVDICEDLWVPVPPSTLAALAGATVLGNLSASNITVAKWEYRQELVCASSARNLAVQLYSAAGFGESTSDLAWDGQGLIAERGILIGETERFVLHGSSVVVDVDLSAIAQDRMRQTSFGGNVRTHAQPPFRAVEFGEAGETRPVTVYHALLRHPEPHPFVPADPAKRDLRCHEVFMIQATSVARRLTALPPEARRVVVGVSGGQDSTHALLVAAHAVDLLGSGTAPHHRPHHAGLRHDRAHPRQRAPVDCGDQSYGARTAGDAAQRNGIPKPSDIRRRSRTPPSRTYRHGCAKCCCSPPPHRRRGSTSAPEICRRLRSGLRPTAAITCRTTASTPACRKR